MPMAHGHAVQHCMTMMGGPSPQMLLHHGDALGLTAEQVGRIEGLRDQAKATAAPHMRAAMGAHTAAAEHLQGEFPDFEAYEGTLREVADHMVLGHVAMARIAVQTGKVLTPEQRATLEELTGRGMMMGDHPQGMMGRGEPGMGAGGMDGMMGCMMMDMEG